MDAATLPGRVHNFCDRGFDAFGSVRDNELDAAQAATPKLAQKADPKGLGLGKADVHAKHLAFHLS